MLRRGLDFAFALGVSLSLNLVPFNAFAILSAEHHEVASLLCLSFLIPAYWEDASLRAKGWKKKKKSLLLCAHAMGCKRQSLAFLSFLLHSSSPSSWHPLLRRHSVRYRPFHYLSLPLIPPLPFPSSNRKRRGSAWVSLFSSVVFIHLFFPYVISFM